MVRIDFNKAFNSSMNYMSGILFKPFIFKKWLALGFVAMLAGFGGGGSGGGNSGSNGSNIGRSVDRMSSDIGAFLHQYLWLILLGVSLLIALGFLFTWLASIFKFVYTDQLVRNSMEIKEPFARLKGLGTSYFLWTLAFGLICLLAFLVIVGIPALIAYTTYHSSTALSIGCMIIGGLLFITLAILGGVIDIFARDFVITAMYVKNLRVMDAWRTVMPTIRANKGQITLYVLLLIVISIASAIISIFALIIAVILIAIPAGILAGLCVLLALSLSLTWNPFTITAVSILGVIVLIVFSYVLVCMMQPLLVFRRVFSLNVLGQLDSELITLEIPEPAPIVPQEPI
ncbi:MAG: DUF7544 domain-containing protein [Armatimonadota bacterium]